MNLKHLKFLIYDSVIFRSLQSIKKSKPHLHVGILLSAMVLAIPSMTVNAQDSEAGEEFEINIGTSVSHGILYRLKERDFSLINRDPNGDDGNLNFDKGLVSSATKVTSEIDISSEDFGIFTRFTGYWDFETADGALKRTELTDKSKKIVGRGVKLLDFYGYGEFEYGDAFGDVRLGNVVLNWGESTFVQNGINIVNPVDVSRVRTPGSEIREALVPVPLVAVSVSPTDNLSLETFAQLRWRKTEIDPVGTYFSTNDYAGEGGSSAEIDLRGFGIPLPPDDQDDWLQVMRSPDKEARNSGQFGLALRYLSEQFNDTEFGVFFTRYHSRRPIVSANTGNALSLSDGSTGAGTFSTATAAAPQAIYNAISALDPTAPNYQSQLFIAINKYVSSNLNTWRTVLRESEKEQLSKQSSLLTRQLIGTALLTQQAGEDKQKEAFGDVFGGFAAQIAIDRYAKKANYFVEYPEEISVFGVSFNTLLGNTGWALQGEISYHDDAPLQREDSSIFAEGLSPMTSVLATPDVLAYRLANKLPPPPECTGIPVTDPTQYVTQCTRAITGAIAKSLGATGKPVVGYIRRDVSQIQMTGTKTFGSVLGADSGVFVAEVAYTKVHNMPDSAVIPLDGPGGSTATDSSWGYRAVTKLDYFNAVGTVNLHPYVQFQHDVAGTTPPPISNFVEGAKTVTLGVSADYLQKWGANLSYTRYFGAGQRNTLRDRDFLEFSINYSF